MGMLKPLALTCLAKSELIKGEWKVVSEKSELAVEFELKSARS